MARDVAPRGKICRKFKENLFNMPKYDKLMEKKPYSPGQHGAEGRRKKLTEYGLQLQEKQKAKYIYGLLEKQFRNTYDKARKMDGIVGDNLIITLESRLDSVVFRSGLAPSQRSARQLVSHKHFLVNDKPVNIPSYILKPGDVVKVVEKSAKMDFIHKSLERVNEAPTSYLRVDKSQLSVELVERPKRSDIPVKIQDHLIVELYSK